MYLIKDSAKSRKNLAVGNPFSACILAESQVHANSIKDTMKKIPLTQGQFALVDDEGFEELSKFKWYVRKFNGRYCAARSSGKIDGKYSALLMHREILGLKPGDGLVGDHINHNTLDNRRNNLRVCTQTQNLRNRTSRKGSSSKFLGVNWDKTNKKWRAQIKSSGKSVYLGCFDSELKAAKTYDEAAFEHYGEFANLNLPNCSIKI